MSYNVASIPARPFARRIIDTYVNPSFIELNGIL